MDGRRSTNPKKKAEDQVRNAIRATLAPLRWPLTKKEKAMRNAIRATLAGVLLSVPGIALAYVLGHVAYAVTR